MIKLTYCVHIGEPDSEDDFDDSESQRIETDVESLDEETSVNKKSESGKLLYIPFDYSTFINCFMPLISFRSSW